MTELHCHVARFEPRLRRFCRDRRSSALLITLIFVALVTILVIAFLGLASQDLKSTYFYVRSDQADNIARGGLDFVVGNLQGEIEDSALSTTVFGTAQSPFYVPVYGTNVFPLRMVSISPATTNILLTSSSSVFYTIGQTPSTMASTIPSTNSSLNNQVISASDWNKPMLVPANQVASMPTPNWVFVSRTGPVPLSSSTNSSAVSPSLTNPNAVIGRYAFVVYDTSGLLDINVAGYDSTQPSMATNAPGKGLLPYADLTQLPGITTNDVNALVQFRNAVSETNYPLALTNGLLSNGFMQVYAPSASGSSDSTFLSRQELIQYANNANNTDWTNALPYLTTFSREFNGPTWGPTTNATGGTYQYQTLANGSGTATATTTYNPNIYAVKVPASWVGNSTNPTRNNGLPWIAGDPLVKYRFPLDKLALLEATTNAAAWTQNASQIQKYFGLDYVTTGPDASNGFYRHWQYPTTNSAYPHTDGQILSLAQVAALATPREPDFFELLQAGILNGSLGATGRSASGTGSGIVDEDPKLTLQTLRIGANIMNQWDSDNYPVTISFLTDSSGDIWNVYGVADLPYITQMFTKAYTPKGNLIPPIYPYIYFQIWNPHQTPPASVYNSANYPSQFRIVPYYNNTDVGDSDSYWFKLIWANAGDKYRWDYIPASATWGSSSPSYFNSLDPKYGGGSENPNASSQGLNFTFNTQINYREPGLVVGTPTPVENGTGGNPWTPPSPPYGGSPSSGGLAAISMPEIQALPPDGTTCAQADSGSTNWLSSAMSQTYTLNYVTQTVWVLQYQDQSKAWRTYATFIGLDTQAPITGSTGWNVSGFEEPTTNAGIGDVSWVKTDPRTFRLGISEEGQMAVSTLPGGKGIIVTNVFSNAINPPLLTPTSVAWYITAAPSLTANAAAQTSVPFRMDYWVANTTNNPSIPLSSNPYMTDPDGAVRGGDSAYGYFINNIWGINPLLPGGSGSSYQTQSLPARPVMLNHPFHSVGDLGYVYRDDPWRTLDFMTPGSADAGLLDLFSLSEAPVVAGRINPNTPYTNVIQALVNGATQSSVTSISGATTNVPSSTAQKVAAQFVTLTSSTPITNRASLVTGGAVSNMINSGYFSDGASANLSLVKTEGESVARSLAESSNTRTWNFLIDVIGQSGHFLSNSVPVSSGGKDNFVVEGERRYWLHIAIDRYTGKVVDQQLEIVDQ